MQLRTPRFSVWLGVGLGEHVRQCRARYLKEADQARKGLRTCPFLSLDAQHERVTKATESLVALDEEVGQLLAEVRQQLGAVESAAKYVTTERREDRSDAQLRGLPDSVASALRVIAGANVLYSASKARAAEALNDAAKVLRHEVEVISKGLQIGRHLAPVLDVKAAHLVTRRRHAHADTKALHQMHIELAELETMCDRLKQLRTAPTISFAEAEERDALHVAANQAMEKLLLDEIAHNAAQEAELADCEKRYVVAMTAYRKALGRQNIDTVTGADLLKDWRGEA